MTKASVASMHDGHCVRMVWSINQGAQDTGEHAARVAHQRLRRCRRCPGARADILAVKAAGHAQALQSHQRTCLQSLGWGGASQARGEGFRDAGCRSSRSGHIRRLS